MVVCRCSEAKLCASDSLFSGLLARSASRARFEALDDRDLNSVLAFAALWRDVSTGRGIGGRLWGGQEGRVLD